MSSSSSVHPSGGGGAYPKKSKQQPSNTISSQLPFLCVSRINKELRHLLVEPPEGIKVALRDPADVSLVDALIFGPADTPYEGGAFHFEVRFHAKYPIEPPQVRHLTGISHFRFGPNLYSNGRVCLSILGTWEGPRWTAACTLESLLLSIQSLLSTDPYINEPGFEKSKDKAVKERYNLQIRFGVVKYAVIDMMYKASKDELPVGLIPFVYEQFLHDYVKLRKLCGNLATHDGKAFDDPHRSNSGKFGFKAAQKEIEDLHQMIMKT